MSLYEQDFYQWTQEQAGLLKAGHLNQLDIGNLIEEIQDMGKSQKRELLSRLKVLLAHMLKWSYEPEMQSRNWLSTITTQRDEIELLLNDNPSLKPLLADCIMSTYPKARRQAAIETGLNENTFPAECPYSLEEILG